MEVEEIRKFIKSHYPDLDEILFFEMHQTEILLFEMAKLKSEELTKLKAENKRLGLDLKLEQDINSDHCEVRQRLVEENTQLKEKLKEVEDCYKLGWEDGAKAAANDIASRI